MSLKTRKPSIKLEREQIYSIRNQINDRIPELLNTLGLSYRENGNRINLPCPIHKGDNAEGFCIYTTGTRTKGNWVCWSHNCQEDHGDDILGFIRGVTGLSFYPSMEFCLKFLNKSLDDIDFVKVDETVHEINKVTNTVLRQAEKVSLNITRKDVIANLDIPSPYFLSRGFSEETLRAFDVGDCRALDKPMTGRAVAPIYDENFQYVGCVGRDISNTSKRKWMHSSGFKKSYLYGLHLAKRLIEEKMSIILVEGQGDVWKLYDAGIRNAVGIFGADLTEDQLITLEKLYLFNVVILTDTDEAGTSAAKSIHNKLKTCFNCFRPTLSTKDVGDMTVEQINEELKPQIKGMF